MPTRLPAAAGLVVRESAIATASSGSATAMTPARSNMAP